MSVCRTTSVDSCRRTWAVSVALLLVWFGVGCPLGTEDGGPDVSVGAGTGLGVPERRVCVDPEERAGTIDILTPPWVHCHGEACFDIPPVLAVEVTPRGFRVGLEPATGSGDTLAESDPVGIRKLTTSFDRAARGSRNRDAGDSGDRESYGRSEAREHPPRQPDPTGMISPVGDCSAEGPSICLVDDSIDVAELVEDLHRAHDQRNAGRARQVLQEIIDAYDWRRLYEVAVTIRDAVRSRYPNADVVRVAVASELPMALTSRVHDTVRVRRERDAYGSRRAFREANGTDRSLFDRMTLVASSRAEEEEEEEPSGLDELRKKRMKSETEERDLLDEVITNPEGDAGSDEVNSTGDTAP